RLLGEEVANVFWPREEDDRLRSHFDRRRFAIRARHCCHEVQWVGAKLEEVACEWHTFWARRERGAQGVAGGGCDRRGASAAGFLRGGHRCGRRFADNLAHGLAPHLLTET